MKLSNSTSTPRWIYRILFASLLLGIALRCLWTSDMEYKFDEQYMFERSQAVGVTESWPLLGMPSGAGTRNPGMSIWIFVALAKIFSITTPLGLVHSVIFLNCLALIALAIFAFRAVSENEREPWLWATIFAAINPITIQFQRKIWAQSVLPMFCVLFLLSWSERRKRVGAFFWGLIGACLGQIHMSGFFFAAGFAIWSAWNDWLNKSDFHLPRSKWGAWVAGSLLGAIPLLPWIHYLISLHESPRKAPWLELLGLSYWAQWIMQSVGFTLSESLGHYPFQDFLAWPRIGSVPTYAVGMAHLMAIISGIVSVSIGIKALWNDRASWRARFIGQGSDSTMAQNAALWGHGGLMLLNRLSVFRHYLIVAFPLQHLWVSRMALGAEHRMGRKALMALAIAQLAISLAFLAYIHTHGGSPDGDYGVAYRAQK